MKPQAGPDQRRRLDDRATRWPMQAGGAVIIVAAVMSALLGGSLVYSTILVSLGLWIGCHPMLRARWHELGYYDGRTDTELYISRTFRDVIDVETSLDDLGVDCDRVPVVVTALCGRTVVDLRDPVQTGSFSRSRFDTVRMATTAEETDLIIHALTRARHAMGTLR